MTEANDPQDGHLQNIFDAIPLPIFIVDKDMRLHQVNKAASEVIGDPSRTFYKKKGGDVMHCIHSLETPGGCGTAPSCADCVIRNSVRHILQGGDIRRKKATMRLRKGDREMEIPILVTVSPLDYGGGELTLLVLEDVSELVQLRNLLPICAWCKKIRNDQNYWQNLEEYLGSHHDIEFTHGMCEDCYRKMMKEDV